VDEVVFGRYRLLSLIGEGDMGRVYKAHDTVIGRDVAIKLLPAELGAVRGYRERFRREARAVARLTEPHIISIHDAGQHDGQLYVVMPIVDGVDLQSLLQRDGPLTPQRAVDIVEPLAAALDAVHADGLVHRDVKPSNVLMTEAGFVYLIDLGVAHDVEATKLTSTGTVAGTWAYMAPERFESGTADARSDVYSLACVLYECLTGVQPFPGTTREEQIAAHLTNDPPAPSGLISPVPRGLDQVIARGMAKKPGHRYHSAGEFAEAARHALTAATGRRWTRPLIAAIVMGLVVGAGITGYLVYRPANKSRTSSSEVTRPMAAPAPPVCADPAAVPAALSTRDKLAQLLMVGVKNADDARAVVADYHVGGIFIGSWTDLSMLTDGSLADIARSPGPLPLAVSVDEEGGRVSRLKKLIGPAPSPKELAATQTVQQVHDLALSRGQAMKKLGITVDFAPVVDVVSDAPDDSVIGDRSFGSDPDVVTTYAGAYAQGLRDAGLLPVLKHFPGHGHGSGDSHKGGVVTPPLAELQDDDLVPYRTLVTASPVAVMVGHLQVPGLTGDDPASLSHAALELLRAGTGYGGPPFDGPVFSDDLSSMAAISDRFGVSEAVLKSLQAGVDIALWVTTDEVPAVLDRLEKAVNAGELKMDDIDASIVRVATMKGTDPKCGH
jgi:beta-N-acetylhexosaminidase